MKSRIFGHRDRTLAVIAIATGVVADAYLGREWLATCWLWYAANHEAVAPIFNWIGGGIAAWVALSQLSIARKRHDAQVKRDQNQTDADKKRRIQESFIKAIEMLGNEREHIRLGAIYALERIYIQESRDDYWMIINTLIAFVRNWTFDRTDTERSENVSILPQDIAAILIVFTRRPDWVRAQEKLLEKRQQLYDLSFSNFSNLNLMDLDLSYCNFMLAKFQGAGLSRTDFRHSSLIMADMQFPRLASGSFAGANMSGTKLAGADLSEGQDLTSKQLARAAGDKTTKLPPGMPYPDSWSTP